jgi:hypothetical protein
MGLISRNPDKGWGGKSDKCVFTGAKAAGAVRTVFGGRIKTAVKPLPKKK